MLRFITIYPSRLDPQRSGSTVRHPQGRLIDEFITLRDAGVFIDDVEGYTADLMNETFYSQEAAIMPAGSWAFGGAQDIAADVTLAGFPIPEGSSFDSPTVYQGFTGVGAMMSPRGESEALGAIRELITLLYEEEIYGNFVADANIVPAIELSDASIATDPLLQQALSDDYDDSTDIAVLMDVHVPPAAGDQVNQAIALAYTGADTDEICAVLDAAY